MPESRPPQKRPEAGEREVDYLICRQCNSPTYIFEIETGKVTEAQCTVCGNDDILLFNIGEEDDELN